MASVDVSQLSKQEHDELSCAYAALLLHDDGLEITVRNKHSHTRSYSFSFLHCWLLIAFVLQGEKLSKVLKASGNEVEAYWPAMFAKALQGQNIEELLSNLASAPVGGAAVAAVDAPAAKVEKVEEKKVEEAADVDMGGLFGDDY
eukprot:403357740